LVFARNDAAKLEIVLLADWSEGVRKRWRRRRRRKEKWGETCGGRI
jgi:hypothetical protein